MKVKLIDREPVRVAYLRHTGPYGRVDRNLLDEDSRARGWARTTCSAANGSASVSMIRAVTKPAQCRYDACVAESGR